MTQATAPTTAHHVATIDLGARGTADVWIREAGMIDIDMPTRNGGTYTLGSDPTSTAHTAELLEAGDYSGFGDLTPGQATELATALRAGITAEGEHTAPLTTHENVRFDDGDLLIVHTSPGGVQVTGRLGGEYVEYAGTAADAREQARLLETDAPDALWILPPDKARRLARAIDGAADTAAPSHRSPCPTWCEDRRQADHWTHPGTTWQAIHARRFGTVHVFLPHEIHDDGERWMGRVEVAPTHPDRSQQLDSDTTLTAEQAGRLGADLTRAAAFATRLELNIAAQAAQGIVTTDHEATR